MLVNRVALSAKRLPPNMINRRNVSERSSQRGADFFVAVQMTLRVVCGGFDTHTG